MNAELEKLTLPELLEQLVDITDPTPVSYMPQTTAWFVLAGILVLAALYFGWRMYDRWRKNAYRRQALGELRALEPLLQRGDTAFERGVAELLRRTAQMISPRVEIIALRGDHWLSHLDRQMPGSEFMDGIGRVLLTEPYRRVSCHSPEDRLELLNLAQRWIQFHRRIAV